MTRILQFQFFFICIIFGSVLIILNLNGKPTGNGTNREANENRSNKNEPQNVGPQMDNGILFDGMDEIDLNGDYQVHRSRKVVRETPALEIHDFSKEYTKEELQDVRCHKQATQIFICALNSDEKEHSHSNQRHSMLEGLRNILDLHPDAGFIEIGTETGLYSIMAAVMGRKVILVEADTDKIKLLHSAVNLNHLAENVTLVENNITSRRHIYRMKAKTKNQEKYSEKTNDIQPIYLDDLMKIKKFNESVLMLNIKHPHRAFEHARRLLNAVKFRAIFMKWTIMRDFVAIQDDSIESMLVAQMCLTLESYGFWPEDFDTKGSERYLDYENIMEWPNEIIWVNESTFQTKIAE